jgi:ribosomal protein S1
MDTANNIDTSAELIHGKVLAGLVDRPFIQSNKLLGAVLRFPGYKETALLHIKQMVGADREKRLSDLKLGEEVRVKLMVSGSHPNRKIWASELELSDDDVLTRLLASERKNVPGRVINTTNYGMFVQLLGGPASGKRGLVHVKNLFGSLKTSLAEYTAFSPGNPVNVDISDARIDNRGVLRIDLNLTEAESAA